jgi:hypothetical protein
MCGTVDELPTSRGMERENYAEPSHKFRIQLLVHYNILVLKPKSHIIEVNWCFQATVSFPECECLQILNI